MEARALGFLTFAPCNGKRPGLGLEGGLSDLLVGGGLCLLASEEEESRSWKGQMTGGFFGQTPTRTPNDLPLTQHNLYLWC